MDSRIQPQVAQGHGIEQFFVRAGQVNFLANPRVTPSITRKGKPNLVGFVCRTVVIVWQRRLILEMRPT